MNTTERQIVAALDRLHRDMVGSLLPCRFHYTGRTDTYSCAHCSFAGRDVVGWVDSINLYPLREGDGQ